MKIVALLPMKANSERVKGKNFRLFNGKPLFKWVLDTLLSLEEIDQVVINTDAIQILAENGLKSGGKVLIRERRKEICGDFVSMNRIIEDDIENVPADLYVMTHTTNPLLTAETLRGGIDFLRSHGNQYDSLFSVTQHQTRFYRKDGSAVNHDPKVLLRTQDLEPWLEENSNFYIFSRESFASTKARIGIKPCLFEMNKSESIDIDDAESWAMAEAMSKYVMGAK